MSMSRGIAGTSGGSLEACVALLLHGPESSLRSMLKRILSLTLLALSVPGSPSAVAQLIRNIDWRIDPDYQHAPQAAREAWQDRKFGMMVHWGVYSVLGLDASWPLNKAPEDFRRLYSTLYQVFNPTEFNADEWASLADRAGMTYLVFTTKHHDGFCMFDTKTMTKALRRTPGAHYGPGVGPVEECYINYSVMDTPYRRDILAALAQAFRRRGLGIGLYYSQIDWNDPDFRWDKPNSHYDPTFSRETDPQGWLRFINRQRQQLLELCTNYGRLTQIMFDGFWPETAWRELILIVKGIRQLQPEVMMTGNIGPYIDFEGSEGRAPERLSNERAQLPWEVWITLGTDWAYTPNSDYRPKEWLVSTLVDVVAKGGSFTPGISPMANGRFSKETVERLEYIGAWLRVNGAAIYRTRPWRVFGEGDHIRFTRSRDGKYVYAISLQWPGKQLRLKSVRAVEGSKITMLGVSRSLRWRQGLDGLVIDVARTKPCEQAYTFKIQAQPYQEKYP
jgi:alpha-L-fucosidase